MRQLHPSGLFVALRLLPLVSLLLALLFVIWDIRLRTRGVRRFPAKLVLFAGLACLVIGPGFMMGELWLLGGQFPWPIWWVFVATGTAWPGLILTAYGGWTMARERRRGPS
jgi:hypothetical protein